MKANEHSLSFEDKLSQAKTKAEKDRDMGDLLCLYSEKNHLSSIDRKILLGFWSHEHEVFREVDRYEDKQKEDNFVR